MKFDVQKVHKELHFTKSNEDKEDISMVEKSIEENTWVPLIYEIRTKGIEINWS